MPVFLTHVLERACRLCERAPLLRHDGGDDAIEHITVIEAHNEQHPQTDAAHYQ